jgi:hypothetical protein
VFIAVSRLLGLSRYSGATSIRSARRIKYRRARR